MDRETEESIDTHRYPMMFPWRGRGEMHEEAIHQMKQDKIQKDIWYYRGQNEG